MAYKIGIIGQPNTGKSFSRKNLRKGEEVFVLSPSHKALHFRDSSGNALKQLKISTEKYKTIEEIAASGGQMVNASAARMLKSPIDALTITGNYYVMKDIRYLEDWVRLVNERMPNIKVLILPDFTHFISEVIAQKEFIARKSGGEAFQRFWELAADALNNFISSIDALREDLLVITEYHSEFNEANGMYEIFVPGGKMLKDKFLPDSYYDVMLYTHVLEDGDGLKQSDRYKFVTRRTDKYNARCLDLFDEAYIQNDLQVVIDKVKEYIGIE